MRLSISNFDFDEERALYHLTETDLIGCRFAGPADGESALKEARDITVRDCLFSLRYPLWHVQGFTMEGCSMDEKARAAIWYATDGRIRSSVLRGIKAVRECSGIRVEDSIIESPEFGWKSEDVTLTRTQITAEYLFLDSRNIRLEQVEMRGKYSFQYVDGLVIENSVLDTKDAFWHAKNVTCRNCTLKGEYLAWFSDGLTLINCHIIGTQPLCYCKNLTMVNCTMEGTDLSFEYSDVQADIRGHIHSVKNIRSGQVVADSVGEIICADAVMECTGKVVIR